METVYSPMLLIHAVAPPTTPLYGALATKGYANEMMVQGGAH